MLKLRSMRLSKKMPLFITAMCLFMAATLTLMVLFFDRATAVKEAQERLSTTAQLFADKMETYFTFVELEVHLLAEAPGTVKAMVDLGDAFTRIGGDEQAALQEAYITNNPYPAGERQKLEKADAPIKYNFDHGVHHPYLAEFVEHAGLYDIFLINPNGDVIYTVFKEADLGANLNAGPLADSGLAEVFRKVMDGEAGKTYFSDFAAYAPSAGVPAGFVANGIMNENGEVIGVLAVQLNMETYSLNLSDPLTLGETGQVNVVGPDMAMRSNSRFEGGVQMLDPIPPQPELLAALNGEIQPAHEMTGLNGETVVAMIYPFKFGDNNWAIVAEKNVSEVMAPVTTLMTLLAAISGAIAVLFSIAGWLYVRTMTSALGRVNTTMSTMAAGSYDVQVPDAARADEIGDIGKVLEGFRDKLSVADMAAQEQAIKQQEQQRVVAVLSTGLVNLSEGNLTTLINENFAPEYEKLRHDFNKSLTTLNTAISEVMVAAGSIKHGAVEISQASDDLSNRTENQAATLEETAAALDELTASVRSAASGAKAVEQIVSEAKSDAEHSGKVVQNAVAAMTEIEKSSEHISQIVGVIEDIAFQTNLLALNAGVEAARAGDAGRGFAVVASEVRALAQRSSEAAKEIKTLIRGSSQQVERGVDLVGKAGDALGQIVQRVAHISNLMSEMATGATEQATGLNEINIGVTQLDQVTQQNAAMVEQATAASHNLNKDAERLTVLMERFHTDGGWSQQNAPMGGHRETDRLKSGSDLSFGDVNIVPIAVNARAPAKAAGANWQDF